ncbi:MAG: hypothetical protein COS85_03680 [Armatimonadetes bacterium CG07_land_8_20_14_0_80_59_28]|nr:MAG: hypothetical protein COS85_03680 [Armatimonadetes bacterium CG07_land_8_20_14_0_80_59_28]
MGEQLVIQIADAMNLRDPLRDGLRKVQVGLVCIIHSAGDQYATTAGNTRLAVPTAHPPP